jgi:hypothetical protein
MANYPYPLEIPASLEANPLEPLNANAEPIHERSGPTSIVINGLPENTTEDNLRSLMAWSYDIEEVRLLADNATSNTRLASAVARFSTHHSCQTAKDLLDGKPNIDTSAYMTVSFTHDKPCLLQDSIVSFVSTRKRHKWRTEHVLFLERKFQLNPKPSTVVKRAFSRELGVEERHIHTWFNNARQRSKQGGMLHISKHLIKILN